jgi:hypothetical protein
MKKTALITAVLAAAFVLVLGSSRADEPQEAERTPVLDALAQRVAVRLAAGAAGPSRAGRLQIRIESSRPPVVPCLAQSGSAGSDPCSAARAMSRLRPCLDLENCPAVNTWRQLYGLEEPRIVPAEPAPPSVPALASAKEEK